MAVVKTTLAAIVAGIFGASEKTISEKLSTEEYNQFSADANQAAEQITRLTSEKATADAALVTMTTRATTAEGLATERANRITELEAERDKYKGWFEGKGAEGRSKPAEDSSNKNEEVKESGLTGYNAGALEHFRKAKGSDRRAGN